MKHLAIALPAGGTTFSSLVLTAEVLAKANDYFISRGKRPVFAVSLTGDSADGIVGNGAFSVRLDKSIRELRHADFIIVPSLGDDIRASVKRNKPLLDWIAEQYRNGAEIAGLCTGTFMLAAAGLLKGKECSTHWAAAGVFMDMFPDTKLAIEKIVTAAHGLYTSGGALSALNLVLHIIEKYYDRETAIYCAKVFEIDLDRSSQSGE